MARTLDPTAHALRRDEFVDVAMRLMQAKGWEQTSIQEILDALGASKGAFYHYFGSKQDLLAAVLERMVEVAMTAVRPVVDDPRLTAVEKFDALFSSIAQWKSERKDLVMAVLEVWLSDGNAIVRERFRAGLADTFTPTLARVIEQGRVEGTFRVASATDTARVLVSLMQGSQDDAGSLYLARSAGRVSFDHVFRHFQAYTDAYERILGAPPGSLTLVRPATLHEWFD